MSQTRTAQLFQEACSCHAEGRIAEAEKRYLAVLRADQKHAGALHNLAFIRVQQGKLDEAAKLLRRAVAANPGLADAHNTLGSVLNSLDQPMEAVAAYDRAIALKPDLAGAHFNRGHALRDLGRHDEALSAYRRVLALQPGAAEAYHQCGLALRGLTRHADAVAQFDQALALQPGLHAAHHDRGLALQALGRHDEAIEAFRAAIALKPDNATAHYNLANTLRALRRHEDAVAAYEQAIAVKPDYVMAYKSLGASLRALRRYAEAVARYEIALAIRPGNAEIHNDLGLALQWLNRCGEAIAHYETALALQPDFAIARSNLLFCLNYIAEVTPEALAAAHREWDRIQGAAAAPALPPVGTAGDDPDRRLRVGYVSPDFRQHSVAYFLRPLLEAHDRRETEIFCYSDVTVPDDMTRRLQEAADHWVDLNGLDTATAAARIRADRIDVLVDLAGHTAGNRLAVFMMKPAPVQMTWLGYPNTTGLAAIDYRITDAIADPPGADRFHSETLIRLPRCFLCYAEERAGPVTPLPARAAGHVTFGSFNMLTKTTPRVVAVWAQILHAVPGARLFLKATTLGDPATRARVLASFAGHGIARERITLSGWTASPLDHLALYGQVDIGLDPFPYNGTTTTCQALWMGVPVITVPGDRHAGRVGASLLAAAGLPGLIAPDRESYVRLAATLAQDLGRLENLRSGLRETLRASPLCDSRDFARAMEGAYRDAWNRRFGPAIIGPVFG